MTLRRKAEHRVVLSEKEATMDTITTTKSNPCIGKLSHQTAMKSTNALFSSLLLLCVLLQSGNSFTLTRNNVATSFGFKLLSTRIRTQLLMGLYDKPLPPRKPFPPQENKNEKKDVDDDDDDDENTAEYVTERLFDFDLNGKEVNDLLPSLGRRLSKGFIECYYEPTDRIVQNLVSQTNVNIIDACWALEACKGDVTEAWTRISVARRMNLKNKSRRRRNDDNYSNGTEYVDDTIAQLLYETEMEEEFLERKEIRQETERQQKLDLYNKPLKANDPWLPGKQNPRPVDDEPWFTG